MWLEVDEGGWRWLKGNGNELKYVSYYVVGESWWVYTWDLCPFDFQRLLSVEIANHRPQIKQIPHPSRCSIPKSQLDLFCIYESYTLFRLNPGSHGTPSRSDCFLTAFKTIEKPGTFKCARSRCKTCPFVQNADKISGPKRSVKITDCFTCTSANVIYCITCTLCKKLYIGETGRRLGDQFREHLRDVEKDDKDAFKPVARHFNLPNHSKEHMSICSLSLHQGTTDSCKNLEQRFIFQIGTLNPHGINERFSFN